MVRCGIWRGGESFLGTLGLVDLDELRQSLARAPSLRPEGRVVSVTGLGLRVALPSARIGDVLQIGRRGREPLDAEVVGFVDGLTLAVPIGDLVGVGVDDTVISTGTCFQVPAGPALLGRVLDGLGRPIDGRPLPAGLQTVPVDRAPPAALSRRRIDTPLVTGVRVIDGLMTLGVGQRVGLFAGSGVGKSTLLGSIARGASADVVVVALVGERGREVPEFLENALGTVGLSRCIVVVSTSDSPALLRLRAAQTATAMAEALRDQGANVLLLVDSITRFARAQREVGLAAGEPPARRGYPPSVFFVLPRLLERAGCSATGAITAIYTVLVEGGDLDEPIADEVRGILDGHVVLERSIANRGQYPAVDPVVSLSRLMSNLVGDEHRQAADKVRRLIAAYEQKRDLVTLGAYVSGSDRWVDRAIQLQPQVLGFLQQRPDEPSTLARTQEALLQLARQL